jgi:NADH:ubiquinone oxidoreductase subunit E
MSQRTISAFNTKKKKVIEVCHGPDCAVAGGGAALLEIEDLILQQCLN